MGRPKWNNTHIKWVLAISSFISYQKVYFMFTIAQCTDGTTWRRSEPWQQRHSSFHHTHFNHCWWPCMPKYIVRFNKCLKSEGIHVACKRAERVTFTNSSKYELNLTAACAMYSSGATCNRDRWHAIDIWESESSLGLRICHKLSAMNTTLFNICYVLFPLTATQCTAE